MMYYNLVKNASYVEKNVNLLVTMGGLGRISYTHWVNIFIGDYYHFLNPIYSRFGWYKVFN